jgi:two-component sensor histidine kinase
MEYASRPSCSGIFANHERRSSLGGLLTNVHRPFERNKTLDKLGRYTDDQRRHAVISIGSVAYLMLGGAFLCLYLSLEMWVAAAAAATCALTGVITIVGLRRGYSTPILGRLLLVSSAVAMVGTVLTTGGIGSPALSWFPVSASIGFLLFGPREGAVWAAVWALLYALVSGLHLAGLIPAWNYASQGWHDAFAALSPGSALLLTAATVWVYEHGRRRSARHVERFRAGSLRLLDGVTDGLLVVSVDGSIQAERSLAASRLVPGLQGAETLWAAVGQHDAEKAQWIELGWEDLASGYMPYTVILEQLPSQIRVVERILKVTYRPMLKHGELTHVFVVLSDITAQIEATRSQELQQEILAFCLKRMEAPGEVRDFLAETRRIVENLLVGGDDVAVRRWIHTLKGGVATFGLPAFALFLHGVEHIVEATGECSDPLRLSVVARWADLEAALAPFLPDDSGRVSVERASLEDLIIAARSGIHPARLADRLERWTWENLHDRLEQIAQRGRLVAIRLGKSHVRFVVDGDQVVVPPSDLNHSFWLALVHVVRNALDHGIESVQERELVGKTDVAEIRLEIWVRRHRLMVALSDNGRGIAWDQLRQRGHSLGLPCKTEDDLMQLLFMDGVSTSTAVTEISGRGLGMAALMSVVKRGNGTVRVQSTPGYGTRFEFDLPMHRAYALSVAS